jgi:diguanylate cyclase (GGDEF)-like protein
MVGGHPYLINSALYYLANHPKDTMEDLLKEIASPTGIYREHLLSCWQKLHNSPECLVALRNILKAPNGANINHATAYKLESCGLIKIQGDRSEIACNLYRQYFSEQNLEDLDLQQELNRLRSENQYLYTLSYQDELTKIANRRYLDYYLAEIWGTLCGKQKPLSMIILDVDHLKIFNDIHGFPAGDDFLRKVAKILKENTDKNHHVIARSGGDEFTVVLPLTDVSVATDIAENIRLQVQSLQVIYGGDYGGLPQCVSISVGVVSCLPQPNMALSQLMQTANQALAKSKFMGGNQLTMTDQLLDPKLQIVI